MLLVQVKTYLRQNCINSVLHL